MREREAPIFEATRRWLEADDRHCFTLVVDELHTYRGTQGTEVSLIVRSLLRRLGLHPDSPQIRCIATSASLDKEAGLSYVEQFFGVSQDTFVLTEGRQLRPDPTARFDLKHLHLGGDGDGQKDREKLAAKDC